MPSTSVTVWQRSGTTSTLCKSTLSSFGYKGDLFAAMPRHSIDVHASVGFSLAWADKHGPARWWCMPISARPPYVTNLLLKTGDYLTAGRAVIAIVDGDSFYVSGYFEETRLPLIHEGDPVSVRLLGEGREIDGRVDSVARAIVDRDNALGADLTANVNPNGGPARGSASC